MDANKLIKEATQWAQKWRNWAPAQRGERREEHLRSSEFIELLCDELARASDRHKDACREEEESASRSINAANDRADRAEEQARATVLRLRVAEASLQSAFDEAAALRAEAKALHEECGGKMGESGCDAARRVIAHLRKSAAGQQKRADHLARAASLNHAPRESDASDSAVVLAGSPASDLRALAASARELAPFVSSSREENEAYARGVTDGQMVLAHRLLLLSSADWPCSTTQLRGNPPTPDANRPAGCLLVHWACSTCGLRAAGTLAELNAAGMAWLKNAWQAHEAACEKRKREATA